MIQDFCQSRVCIIIHLITNYSMIEDIVNNLLGESRKPCLQMDPGMGYNEKGSKSFEHRKLFAYAVQNDPSVNICGFMNFDQKKDFRVDIKY